MKISLWPTLFVSSLLAPVLAFTIAVAGTSATADPVSTTLPDTVAGEIAQMVISHINADTPETIQQWAPSILSTSVDADARAAVLKQLAVAARDSGGVDFVDARTQGPPGMLVVTIKGRRTGQRAALVLLPDPEQPGKLVIFDIVPVDDPTLYAAWPRTVASQAEIAQLAEDALNQLERTADFSGCLTISDGVNTFFDECRGLADRTFGVEADQQTKFHIGSMNKMFTAVAIAQLVESGKLGWDSTLAELMPEYPDQATAAKITVWQLLHHTAGLGDFFVPEFFQNRENFVNPVDYIQRHIFTPAGMMSSGFDSQEDITQNLAIGYFREGAFATSWKANWMTLPFRGSPAGGGYSTNGDLLRFASALRDGELIKAETLQKMFEDGVPVGPGTYAAGFGDRVSSGRHIRGHAGGAPGMSANLAIVWETGAVVAVTSNQGDTPTAMLLSERIADLLAGQQQ